MAYKTVIGGRKSDSGGDSEQGSVAKRMTKGMKPGIGTPTGEGPKPYAAKMGTGKNSGHKLIPSKDESRDSGAAIDAWCCGKRSTYK